MTTLTVENYLKAILQHELQTGEILMSTGKIAEAMIVSPGTVTSMLKTLSESQLAEYKPYEGAALTESGRKLAMRMLRRHRLIELFLVKTLDLTWDQVHEEAEDMEHSVSDFLVGKIDEFLGRPQFDPHGDPIPTEDGQLRGTTREIVSLSSCQPGQQFRLARVTDQQGDFLRYLSDSNLNIDTTGVVENRNLSGGIMTISVNGNALSLGLSAAESLLVVLID
ncbi:MAG: metal-dependent transcriptional regulator [Planctomycetaceae bacterium]|jgi:DtxR family transcriptional regulator, Mn-dependent transcriptional regulator|nr:metal-dependent transcriptional regulator [Planctomycetaceae bacterium]